MSPGLTQRQHAAASLFVLLALLFSAYIFLISPAISERARFHDRLAELRFQYEKLAHTIGRVDDIRAELERLSSSQPDQTGFLEQKQEALAAADLQKHINSLISVTGGNVISTQVLRSAPEETLFPGITIKVHMRGNMESLQELLYRFKTGQPVLLIDNLLIQKRNVSSTRRNQQEDKELDIRFDATGFIYQEPAAG